MTVQIVVPELGESVIEATVARWMKQAGERVTAGEPVVVLETDKVDLEVAAAEDGVLAQIHKQAGEDVKVGDVLGAIDESASAQPTPASGQAQPAAEAQKTDGTAKTEPQREPDGVPGVSIREVTPVARRLAEEQQVDLTKVTPQSGGRVTKDDVQRYLETRRPPTPAPAAADDCRAAGGSAAHGGDADDLQRD